MLFLETIIKITIQTTALKTIALMLFVDTVLLNTVNNSDNTIMCAVVITEVRLNEIFLGFQINIPVITDRNPAVML